MPGRELFDRLFSDRDEDEDSGFSGGGGGASYDEDENEDGGWVVNKDNSDSLWDSAEDSDEEEEEGGIAPLAAEEEEEDGDMFGESIGPRRRGRKPAPKPIVRSIFELTGEMPIPEIPAAAPVVKAGRISERIRVTSASVALSEGPVAGTARHTP